MTREQPIHARHRGSDREAALRADEARQHDASLKAVDDALSRLLPFTQSRNGIHFGCTPGPENQWVDVTLPFKVAHELSGWVLGTTGAGKTTWLLSLAAQDLTTPARTAVYLDYQGAESGFAHLLTNAVIPGVVARSAPHVGASLLANLRTVSPWQNRKLPSLHLTSPGGNVNARAASLIDIFGATTSVAGAGEFGPRMLSLTLPAAKLLIRKNVPVPLMGDILTNESLRLSLAATIQDPELQAYFRDRFAADFRDAGAAVLSRLDRFASDDSTRLACFAPDPFDAADWIERGTTVVNLGGATPLHRSFWAAFIQTSILGAILSRRPTRTSPRVLVRIDEAQVGLPSTAQARELDDALSRMRGRRAALTICHQHGGQLSEYPFLRESLRANAGYVVSFRVPPATFAASGCAVPEGLLPGMPERLTEAQNRDVWERVVENLPKRTFLLHAPDVANATIPVRAAEFDVDAFVRGVPSDIVDLAREGQAGHDRDELAGRERAWRNVVTEIGTTTDPNIDALERFAGGPRGRASGGRPRRAPVEIG